ncbi:MAG: hypothetical protein WCT45_02655 [Candidatus Paceibacterota bacterium]|jgi:hypothetical protein
MKYLITHGLRDSGVLPQHTEAGIAQFANLPKMDGVAKVVVGTGIRFMEIYRTLVANGQLAASTPVVYSPFCGSADGLDPPDTILMADGSVCKLDDYIGFGNTKAFDPWVFIAEQPVGTLFCAGGELMMALGCQKVPKAALFGLNSDARTFELVTQG